MKMPQGRRRNVFVVVGAVVCALIAGLAVFVSTRSTVDRPQSFCWGLLPADDLEALLPPGEYEDRSDTLDYPSATSDGCEVRTDIEGRPVIVFRYTLGDDYARTDQFYGIGARQTISTPLGNDLIGAASDLEGWVQVPPCMPGEEPRYARLDAHDLRPVTLGLPARNRIPGRVGNRERIASAIVGLTNSARREAGCALPELPAPAGRAEPTPNAFLPGATLCGVPVTGVDLGTHPSWVERWSGSDAAWEDCVVSDRTSPDEVPALRSEVRRGVLADLDHARTSNPAMSSPEGKIVAPSGVGQGSRYFARCATGSVSYLLTTRPDAPLPPSERLLRALIAGNAARDGCVPPT